MGGVGKYSNDKKGLVVGEELQDSDRLPVLGCSAKCKCQMSE